MNREFLFGLKLELKREVDNTYKESVILEKKQYLDFMPAAGVTVDFPELMFTISSVVYDTTNMSFRIFTDKSTFYNRTEYKDVCTGLKKEGWVVRGEDILAQTTSLI